jgi:hypothetical protein
VAVTERCTVDDIDTPVKKYSFVPNAVPALSKPLTVAYCVSDFFVVHLTSPGQAHIPPPM